LGDLSEKQQQQQQQQQLQQSWDRTAAGKHYKGAPTASIIVHSPSFIT